MSWVMANRSSNKEVSRRRQLPGVNYSWSENSYSVDVRFRGRKETILTNSASLTMRSSRVPSARTPNILRASLTGVPLGGCNVQ